MDTLDLKEVDHVQTSAPVGLVHDGTVKAGLLSGPAPQGGNTLNPAFAVPSRTTPSGAEVWIWSTSFMSNASIYCFATPI